MPGKTPMWRRYLTFWGRDVDRDLRDELAFHFEARTRELVEAGWTPEAAKDEARRVFGDPDQILSECRRIDTRFEREQRMTSYLEDIRHDVLFALRQVRRQPKFWSVIVLTLVVGVAASTSIFAIVDGVLLKPLPYPEPDRLVRLTTWSLRGEFVLLSERTATMDLAAYYPVRREVTIDVGGEPARVPASGVTAGLFDVLGVPPMLGRSFTADEMRPNGPGIAGGTFWRTYGVVIVSAGFWQSVLGGGDDVIGRALSIEGHPHTIVGVMPPAFRFPNRDTALWFPHNIDPANPNSLWAGNVATMIGRLRDGHEVAQARAELRAVLPSFVERIPWGQSLTNYGADADVQPLADSIVGDARPVLLVLLAAIGLVLLVVCVNVANLLLARGVARDREIVTRAALGAGRGRLVRQLIVENVTIAAAAGIIGAVIAWASLRTLVALLPADLPRIDQIQMDARVLFFAMGVSVATGLIFGLLPALRATRRSNRSLAHAARGTSSDAREGRLTGALAAVQLSLAVVLAVSAALLLRSLWNLTAVDPGFRVDRLVAARVAPPGFADWDPAARALFADRLLERLQAEPGVASAALATAVPFDVGLFATAFTIQNRSDSNAWAQVYLGVTPGYLETMGTRILEGRGFTQDDGAGGPHVALVSRSLARSTWGDESPIGARIRFQDQRQPRDADGNAPWFTIVGVVDDVRWSDLSSDSPPMVYLPLDRFWSLESLRIVVRTPDALTDAVAPGLRTLVSELDPRTPVSDIRTFGARLGEATARPRFAAYLLAGFAGIALFLAAIGVYGVLSYAMHRRVPEIGVRLAFGASGRDVFVLLFGRGLTLTLAGIAIGLPLAFGATQFLSSLLFGVEPVDTTVFTLVPAVLLLVGLAAAYIPARRAARVDPMQALRQDGQ